MIARTLACTICLAALATGPALAQQPAPAPRPAPRAGTPGQPPPPPPPPPPAPVIAPQPPATAIAPQPPAPRREGQPVNVKVEVTITDQRGSGAPVKKTLTVVAADGRGGFIRSLADAVGITGGVPLNVDVEPTLLNDGKIRVQCNVQYDLPASQEELRDVNRMGTVKKTAIHEALSLILENGKSIVAAQSADPISDRQVTVELKATVLR